MRFRYARDLAANLPKIMADRVQMQQVLMNIMLNGIEAMKDTGGVLTVKSQLGQDGRVLISISDTGVGLPAEKLDQIFSAFFTTKPQGSGMGLAISRSIVESHRGRLWATPNDGRGATFQFTLPVASRRRKSAPARKVMAWIDRDPDTRSSVPRVTLDQLKRRAPRRLPPGRVMRDDLRT